MCIINDINEEVALMGSFADGFEKKIRQEVEQELKGDYDRKLAESKRETEENRRQFIAILVRSLSSHTDSFDQMYKEVTSNNIFADVTREELKQIMASASCALSTT